MDFLVGAKILLQQNYKKHWTTKTVWIFQEKYLNQQIQECSQNANKSVETMLP